MDGVKSKCALSYTDADRQTHTHNTVYLQSVYESVSLYYTQPSEVLHKITYCTDKHTHPHTTTTHTHLTVSVATESKLNSLASQDILSAFLYVSFTVAL